METIIATIQPVHLGNIRSGKKNFEIRKTLPAPLKIGHPVRCLCCESGSGGQIKAEFIIDKADVFTLQRIFENEHGDIKPLDYIYGTCVQWKFLCDYMRNHQLQPIYFWHISNMIDYCNTKGYRVRNIAEFGLKRPPQSWQFVKEA